MGGGGFGAPSQGKAGSGLPQKGSSSKKVRGVPPLPSSNGGGSLEKKLLQQHAENCAASALKWATCADDSMPGSYSGGWDALPPVPPISPNGNEPYGTERLILKSRAPLLSADECATLIEQMEAHGAANGWDSRYPVTGYTREVNVADIPASVELLNTALATRLLPAAASQFRTLPVSSLRVNEALVVKYDAATGNNCLPVHEDFSYVTINVALSGESDFEGGGTWFQHSAQTVVAGRGEVVMHAGGVPHCGVPVSRGARYQLVLFVLSAAYAELPARLKAIGAAAGAKASSSLMDVPFSSAALERSTRLNPLDCEAWSQLAHNRSWPPWDGTRCVLHMQPRYGTRCVPHMQPGYGT